MNPIPLSAHSRFRTGVARVEIPGLPAMVPGNSMVKEPGVAAHRARRVQARLHVTASQKALQGVIAAVHFPGNRAGVRRNDCRSRVPCGSCKTDYKRVDLPGCVPGEKAVSGRAWGMLRSGDSVPGSG